MLYRRGKGVALRSLCKGNRHRISRLAAICIALPLCAGLPACTSDPSWPTLGKVSDLGNVMTPEERQKAVQELQKADQGNNNTTGAPAKQGQ